VKLLNTGKSDAKAAEEAKRVTERDKEERWGDHGASPEPSQEGHVP